MISFLSNPCTMNRSTLYQLLIAGLLILNIVLLVFIFTGKNQGPHPPRHDVTEAERLRIAKEVLGFNEAQMKGFEKSKEDHGKRMKPLHEALRKTSEEYYHLSVEEDARRSTLLQEISEANIAIYRSHTIHFDELRALARPDQRDTVEEFINGLLKNQERPRRNGLPRRPPG